MARRPRQRSSSQSGRTSALWGATLLLLAMAAFGALAWFYFYAPRKPVLDSRSLCPVTGSKGIAIVLMDTSDVILETTKSDILTFLEDQITALPEYHSFDIRVLDIATGQSRSLFAKCNPGDGDGLSEWTDNPRVARLRWIESFKKPAREALSKGLAPVDTQSSPIMGAVQHVAITQFSSAAAQAVPKRLIIVSDMIEHTRDYSQYPIAGDLTYQRFKQSPAYRKFRTDLHGTHVTILYVDRPKLKLDTIRHISFWREWISDNRGSFGSAQRLQGAN